MRTAPQKELDVPLAALGLGEGLDSGAHRQRSLFWPAAPERRGQTLEICSWENELGARPQRAKTSHSTHPSRRQLSRPCPALHRGDPPKTTGMTVPGEQGGESHAMETNNPTGEIGSESPSEWCPRRARLAASSGPGSPLRSGAVAVATSGSATITTSSTRTTPSSSASVTSSAFTINGRSRDRLRSASWKETPSVMIPSEP